MLQSKEQSEKVKETIKTAFVQGDVVKLIQAGFESFMNMLCSSAPLPFQRFLEYTGASFDKYIQDITKEEHLNFVGGKMILTFDKLSAADSALVHLTADFYFQTPDKKWIMKKKSGEVGIDRFSDWENDAEAAKLKSSGKLELSIEPPEAGA